MVLDVQFVFLWPKSAKLRLINGIYIKTGRNPYFKEQNPDLKNLEAHGNREIHS